MLPVDRSSRPGIVAACQPHFSPATVGGGEAGKLVNAGEMLLEYRSAIQ